MYRVVGRRIQHNGQPINLHSVNVIGMELKENVIFGLWTGLTIPQYLAHIKSLKFNCLRLPIGPRVIQGAPVAESNLATWVPGNAYLSGKNSLQVLDEWIKECEKIGLRYIFDMHYLDDNGNIPDLWYTNDYTETHWLNDMKFLAGRYKGNAGFVGIDTKNEPNSNTATWGTGVLATDWKLANERAYQAINSVNDQILIIVEPLGVELGLKQLTNNPVNIPLSRLVLSPHVYGPDVWWPFGLGFNAPNFPNNMPAVWDEWFGDVAQTQAVWIGEWGGQYGNKLSQDKAWADKFVAYLKDRGIYDHAYWGWQDDAGPDTGGILADGGYRNVRQDKVTLVSQLVTAQTKFSNETLPGTIPTPTTPPAQASASEYRVIGNKIYHNGNHVQLQGVNVIGFELSTPVMGGLWSGQTIAQFIGNIKGAGFNCIRFPVGPKALEATPVPSGFTAAEWLPANNYLLGKNALQLLDEVIKECEALGMRYIFDVHYLDANGNIPDLWYETGVYPETKWLENISTLASRYKGKPGFVGIDIKNEPSDNTSTWGSGIAATDWRLAAQKAFAAMNAVNQDILFILPAIKHTGGFDQILNNLPTGVPDNRLVLTQHIYGPSVWNPNGSDFQDPSFPANMAAVWDAMMGNATGNRAIFIGEFGGQYATDPEEKLWEDAFVQWIDDREIENFAYWGWGPNSGPTTGGIVGEDYKTADSQKIALLHQLKTPFAKYTYETSTPVAPPVQPPAQSSGGKYRIRDRHVYHNGHKIQLFGVNLTGFELANQNFLSGIWTGQTIRQMLTQIKSLRFNALRITIGPKVFQNVDVDSGFTATWLPENAYLAGKKSLELLDEVIKECESLNFRYILDHHHTLGGPPSLWYTNEYPESQWLADLVTMATRYKGNKGFMGIDLRNEPNDKPGGSTWGTGILATDWRLACKRAFDAISAVNDDIFVIVEPLNANPMLEQIVNPPVQIPADKLALSPHVYGPDVWLDFGEGFNAPNFPYNMPSVWDARFGNVAKTHYVNIGEFGGWYGTVDPKDDDWQDAFASYLKANDITDFFYWMWGHDSHDTGGIVGQDYRTVRTDKMSMLDTLWTPSATYANETLTVVTPPPIDVPVDPENPPIDPENPPGLPGGYSTLSRGLFNVNYRNLLLKLFPKGRAWRIEIDTITAKLLSAVAVELKRVDTAVSKIYLEADPRTAEDTLSDWEKEYGLPDECSVLAGSIEQRRANLISKITATGGQSEAYFKSITGTTFDFPITYQSATTLPMTIGGSVRGMAFKHIWYADITSAEYEWFEAGDPVDTPINVHRETANLQCLIEKYKPAHTYVIYK